MRQLITAQEVLDEFKMNGVPKKKDTSGNAVFDVERTEEAINDAQVHMMSYLRKVGVDITNISLDTERELRRPLLSMTRYYFNSSVGGAIQEGSEILRNYEEAINFLKDVSRGTLVLTTSKSKKSGFKIIKLGTI